MNETPQVVRRGRRVLLGVLLLSVYMITYSARIESGDTRLFFDAISSFVDRGDFLIDGAAWFRFPNTFEPGDPAPLRSVEVEPAQILAASPLYVLAKLTPGLGLVHTVWLFNVLIAAAACLTLYAFAVTLGYTEKTALIAAILLGTATIIFPYTRTFFREPLAMLFLLLAALAFEKLRQSEYSNLVWAGIGVMMVILMIGTKASTLFAFPALLIAALPSIKQINRRLIVIAAAAAVVVIGILIFLNIFEIGGDRYDILDRLFRVGSAYFPTALSAYLLSPGASFWGTSPVLLLAIPGAWMLVRAGKARYPLAATLLILAFAFGYAFLNDAHWFGGLSFPPRFLVPILPFVMIVLFPVIERISKRPIGLLHAAAVVLIAYSVWIQLSAVGVSLTAYPAVLPPEANGLGEWSGGLYDPQWFRWFVLPFGSRPLDAVWVETNLPLWGIVFGALALSASLLLLLRRPVRGAGATLLGAWIIAVVLGLRSLYDVDWRFGSGDRAAHDVISVIETETNIDDVILMSNPRYEDFFHNYGKFANAGRLISLPPQPGDQPSPEQAALVRSENVMALLDQLTAPFVHTIASAHDRIWLLVDGTPDLAWQVRPVERFLSTYYYPIRAIQVGDFVRLVEYSTVPAPDPLILRGAETAADLVFGDSIRLLGVELPAGMTYQGGDALPISLLWSSDAPLSERYTVAVYLRDAGGAPIAQHDGYPAGGFAPTDTWDVNIPVWDHRAISLPDDLPPGNYQLWVKIYRFTPDGSTQDLPVSGSDSTVIDGVIGVLPITVIVTQAE